MESILISIKKLLGLTEDNTDFDPDVIIHINNVFAILTQLGIGPAEGFIVNDSYSTWNDFMGDSPKFSMVKTYTYLKVKLVFDPPLNSSYLESMKNEAKELEWRITNPV